MKKNIFKKLSPYIFALLLIICTVIISKVLPINYELYNTETISYVKGKVVSVNYEEKEDCEDLPGRNVGRQNITVLVKSGEKKGEKITFDNILSSTHSIEVDRGTNVIVKCDAPENIEPYYSLYSYNRSGGIVLAALVFILFITIAGKTKGLRSSIALVISLVIIVGGVIPAVYNGLPPVAVTLAACIAITTLTLTLLNGFSKKTFTAVAGTIIGLCASAVFYVVITKILTLNGYALEETETLIMISRETGLNIRQLLFSGIMLASLGAVMDTAMSISSALGEIASAKPDISGAELMKRGMNIGGDMIGTMCQTLVLAFTGGALASVLVMVSYGTQLHRFLSSDFLAVELLQGLTGSFAVVLTVPITALLSSIGIPDKHSKQSKK